MIRQLTFHLLIVLLPVIYSEAYPKGSVEVVQDDLECNSYCLARHRICHSAPTSCGPCVDGYTWHDGQCMELETPSNFDSDDFIDRVAAEREQNKAAQAYRILGYPLQNLRNKLQADTDEQIVNTRDEDNTPVEAPQDIKYLPALNDNKVEVDGVVPLEHTKGAVVGSPDVKVAPDEALLHNTPHVKSAEKHHLVDDVASMADVYFLAVVAACSVAGVIGLVVAGVCWYRLQKNAKAASETEYPAYGVTGPPQKEKVGSPGDRKLAQSAQMYHYQHQKQQMIAMEKANGDMNKEGSEADSDEENEEGDYTVYECPGLAPTGEMEVKNPLFSEDTPVTPNK